MKFFLLIILFLIIFFLRSFLRILRVLFLVFTQNKNRGSQRDDDMSFTNTIKNSPKIIKENEGEYVAFEEVDEENELEDKE